MNLPWEAILGLTLAVIGFIGWLTKISVLQDVGLDKMRDIQKTIVVIEATYATQKDLDRVDQAAQSAHKRIDLIRGKGYDTEKTIGG